MSDFDVLGTVGKLALPTFARFWIYGNPSLGSRDMVPRTGAAGVFLVRLRTVFRSGFRLDPVKSWRSESSTSCMNVSSFQRARTCGSTCCESGRLCAQAWQRRWESSEIFSTALFRRPIFMCVVDVRFWPVKCRIEALIMFFRMLSKLWEMYPKPHFEGFWAWWTLVRSGTAWSNPGQHLVNPGQTWSKLPEFWEMYPGPCSEVIWCGGPSSDRVGSVRAVSFCVPIPEKISWVALSRTSYSVLQRIGAIAFIKVAEGKEAFKY
uniref:Uncharacterized protein n=1 Tax=Fagus sylvatica TaxID=28930 RepID=A0A2N9HCR5_FAGSY